MSHFGQQLRAPEGWGALVKGRRYFFMGFLEGALVRLAFFEESPNAVYFDFLQRADFEAGLTQGAILPIPDAEVRELPPWLGSPENVGIHPKGSLGFMISSRRKRRAHSPEEEVDRRLAAIEPLISDAERLLKRLDLEQEVKRFARQSKPELNEKRTLLWLCAYLCFSRNKWALLPGRSGCGRKSIEEAGPGDYGRPSPKRGRRATARMTITVRLEILKAWKQFARRGRTRREVVQLIMTEALGYKVRKHNGILEYFNPTGGVVYTEHQTLNALIGGIGRRQLQMDLYGREFIRVKKQPSKGRYSAFVANLLERVEGDAYTVEEVPLGPLDGHPMRPLYVVRLRCVVSGMIVGIGFSIGGERATAYRMALFCMAVGAVRFCALFGVRITEEEWPCKGVPSWLRVDRGPAGTVDFIVEFEAQISIRELTPSNAGQSKATVESSHPKKEKTMGAPEFRQSKLNYVELAVREIRRAIADNNRIVMFDRQTINMARAHVFPTPLEIWKYLDARFRTNAHPLAFDDAVSAFLSPLQFNIHEHGAILLGQVYWSEELGRSGLCDRALQGVIGVSGFGLETCLRAAWIVTEGKTIRVNLSLPIMDDERQLYISLPELEEINSLRLRMQALEGEHRNAAASEMRQQFAEQTGKSWDDGVTRRGRAKRGEAGARAEQADVNRALRPGRK